MSLSVIKAGFQDIVQDLGRVGYTHLGISPTGAADSMSLRMGNLLLGNDLNNAGLEITLFGGTYRFNKNTNAMLSGPPETATAMTGLVSNKFFLLSDLYKLFSIIDIK